MKTIEWLAADKYINQREQPVHKQIPAKNYIDWAQFGAREAQRWINIEEELPEKGIQVLVKNKYGVCDVDRLLNSGWEKDFEFPYTHWRLIERE
ncbi:MAG: hypothetical protein LUE98_11910 [Tannerellaceae bacterium]|nr:hypothetical protein [Tannerellaceae bacterium]